MLQRPYALVCSFWWTLLFQPWLHCTQALAHSVFLDAIPFPLDIKAIHTIIIIGTYTADTPTDVHISKLHVSFSTYHRVCLGLERMSCRTAAAQCCMDSSCTAGGQHCSVLFSKMAGVMTPETLYSHTGLLWFPWGWLLTVTLSILVLNLGICVNFCYLHCCLVCLFLRSDCFVIYFFLLRSWCCVKCYQDPRLLV